MIESAGRIVLNIPLSAVKDKAENLLKQDDGLTRQEAYIQALAQIVMHAAESNGISPFEEILLEVLDRLSQNGKMPVSIRRLSIELPTMSDWSLWDHLSQLRSRGLVYNIGRTGWLKTTVAEYGETITQ